tara:strand:- start:3370 stop:4143 length:774 start_codon:yes stop_codon:yes gene_type:complete
MDKKQRETVYQEQQLNNKVRSIVINNVIGNYTTRHTWVHDFSPKNSYDHFIWLKFFEKKWWGSDNRLKYIRTTYEEQPLEKANKEIHKLNIHQWFFIYKCNPFKGPIRGDVLNEIHDNMYRDNIVSCQNSIGYAFHTENKFEQTLENIMESNPNLIFLSYHCPQRIKNKPLLETSTITLSNNIQKNISPFGNHYTVKYPFQNCTPTKLYLINELYLESAMNEYGYELIFDTDYQDIVQTPDHSMVSLNKAVIYMKEK